jgi:hypothetical protein
VRVAYPLPYIYIELAVLSSGSCLLASRYLLSCVLAEFVVRNDVWVQTPPPALKVEIRV